MRHVERLVGLAALIALLPTAPLEAQLRLLAGGGITSPVGDLADQGGGGLHATLGVQVGVPTLPVAIRLDGSYHSLGEESDAFLAPSVLGGALDVVFELPGVGLTPYVLGGIGRYRVKQGPVDAPDESIGSGWQVGFGLALGSSGTGAFAEIRYVRVTGETFDPSFVPLSVGLRL